ncbi:MAG: hypothetical protein KAT68_06785 [Bacteroidales bacterium]|nr:hypothetical protein [Bacteroidales bacterium]
MKFTKINLLIILIFSCLIVFNINAQTRINDCQGTKEIFGLKKGSSYTAECDSIIVMTFNSYEYILAEKKQHEDLNKLLNNSIKMHEEKQQILDSMITKYKSHIDSLDLYLAEKDSSLTKIGELVEQSTKNTDDAIKKAKANRLWGIGGTVATILVILFF